MIAICHIKQRLHQPRTQPLALLLARHEEEDMPTMAQTAFPDNQAGQPGYHPIHLGHEPVFIWSQPG